MIATEDVVTRYKADTSGYDAPVDRSAKAAERFGDTAQKASGHAAQAMTQLGTGARGAAAQIALLAKGQGDLENALSATSHQVGTMGTALGQLGAGAGGAMGKMGGLLSAIGPWGAVAGAAIGISLDLGRALVDLVREPTIDKTGRLKRAIEEMDEAMRKADATAATFMQHQAQIEEAASKARFDAEDAERRAKDARTEAAFRKATGAAPLPTAAPAGGGRRTTARPDDTAARQRTEDAMRAMGTGGPAAEGPSATAAGMEQLRADHDKMIEQTKEAERELAEQREHDHAQHIARMNEAAEAQKKHVSEWQQLIADFQSQFPGGALAAMLYPPESGAAAMMADNEAMAISTVAMTTTIGAAVQGMANGVGQAYGQMIGSSVKYRYANAETAKQQRAMQLSTTQTIRVATRDMLKSVAMQAATQAVMETALGFAASATGNPSAAMHFASAKMFAATAVLAGVGAAAIPAVTKTIPGGTDAKGAGGSTGGVGLGAKEGAAAGPTIINVSLQVLPGTDYARVGEETERAINMARRERGNRPLAT